MLYAFVEHRPLIFSLAEYRIGTVRKPNKAS